jgi:hypothetical protein
MHAARTLWFGVPLKGILDVDPGKQTAVYSSITTDVLSLIGERVLHFQREVERFSRLNLCFSCDAS